MEQELITVEEVAKRLQVQASWVYAHSSDLGALRLGKYLRFSWSRVLQRLDREATGSDGAPPSRRRAGNEGLRGPHTVASEEIMPVKGKDGSPRKEKRL